MAFREVVRKKRTITKEKCIEVLINEPRGVLSVQGDDGYPYGVPLNHYYDEETGNLYFHGGKSGHRIDALENSDKVSYCVYDKGYRNEGEWALNINSVVVFGRMHPVDDMDRLVDISRKLSYKFTSDDEYIDEEIRKYASTTLLLELVPEHITGKLINEA